ncbi:MAG: hypothetical protein C0467_01655 [Planctomycetaceae bacterium]|nr:hypothetical protein [Planctomycetaceae bacterium]
MTGGGVSEGNGIPRKRVCEPSASVNGEMKSKQWHADLADETRIKIRSDKTGFTTDRVTEITEWKPNTETMQGNNDLLSVLVFSLRPLSSLR